VTKTPPTDAQLLTQLLTEYRQGYLKEDILERAIINIARHYSRSQGDVLREWLICGLLLTAGALVLLWIPRYGFKNPQNSHSPSVSPTALKKVDAMQVATPNLLDDTPPGAYDFTLMQANNTTKDIPVPAPCSGTVVKVWFQGQTGDLQTGQGGGNIIDLECRDARIGWRMAHFNAVWAKAHQAVKAGDGIGGQGCTGRCSGDHVHAQLHRLPDWERIENRSVTAPLVDAYLNRVRSGRWSG
jgi:Peptidase family M23